ncbi:MAG: DUF58 domain-containing protein [Saprospiraceae bacterium]
MKNLFLSNRFFYVLSGVIALFVLSFPFGFLFPVAQTALVLALAASISDMYLLFNPAVQLKVRRYLPKVFSLGDDNRVQIVIENLSSLKLNLIVIDELPVQFQRRDFEAKLKLTPGNEKKITYQLRPVARGAYSFGDINLFLESFLGLVQRRYQHHYPMEVPVYPSILQMKKFELKAFNRTSHNHGIKKIRRLGHSYEFEQIKNYVQGDDFRSINWKASSRRGTFMVNQYQDERAQQVYNIIDKGRAMKMPFNGLSLIDYAINTTLVISNVALQKYDRAGLISFSDKIGSTIKAEKKPHQLNKILTALYKEQERNMESNFELLYYSSRKLIKGRSLLFLYTNFESIYAMERVMPILRRINNLHLLVVIFFENTEVKDYAKLEVTTTEEIYHQTIAQKFVAEKVQMVQTLKQYGIQAILTPPEELSVNTINKYLELKSRGLI